MFKHTAIEIIGHADIQRAVAPRREHVNTVGMLMRHVRPWIPARGHAVGMHGMTRSLGRDDSGWVETMRGQVKNFTRDEIDRGVAILDQALRDSLDRVAA